MKLYLQEERETLDVEDDVVLDQQVGDIMKGAGSVVGVVNGISSDIACAHISRKMEMDWVSSNSESLSSIEELCVLNSGSHKSLVFVFRTDNNDGSHLI